MTGADHTESKLTKARTLSSSEQTWCRAVSGGTATTAIVLQMAKPPSEISLLHQVLRKLLQAHPILRHKLHYNTATKEFSFLHSTAEIQVEFYDMSKTTELLRALSDQNSSDLSPCQLLLENELNKDTWREPRSFPGRGVEVVFASVYSLSERRGMLVLRLHAAVCDRTTGESLLRELMEAVVEAEGGRRGGGGGNEEEGKKAIEDLVPDVVGMKKSLWGHGMDMLGYSLNSLRLTNLKFKDTKRARCSQVVRLQMNTQVTSRLVAGCKSRGIKLCGALAAAGLMAAHSTRPDSDKLIKKKYGVVTLVDSRSLLQPPLSSHHFGFYQLPLLNIHTINGGETFWDLAEKTYRDFAGYKESNKHFSDMRDLSFLMGRAIENPGLTTSSSQRTSLMTVFEDPIIENTEEMKQEIGVEDYMGCSSAHGVGPSMALFDTIRDGELECLCVYPSPLHSREQITHLLHLINNTLIHATF